MREYSHAAPKFLRLCINEPPVSPRNPLRVGACTLVVNISPGDNARCEHSQIRCAPDCPPTYGSLLVSASLLVCGLDDELVEYLDRRDALEVGDRRLDSEDETLEGCAVEDWLFSFLGSL